MPIDEAGLICLGTFEQAQRGTHEFTDGTVTACPDTPVQKPILFWIDGHGDDSMAPHSESCRVRHYLTNRIET